MSVVAKPTTAAPFPHGDNCRQATELHPAPPPWTRTGRIPSLNGLRAIAVLLVLLVHASNTRGFPRAGWIRSMASQGAVGVDVFFVISGFLITMLMLRELKRTNRLHLGHFYLRRILRIIPAYTFLLVVVALLEIVGYTHLTNYDWFAALTYTVNFLPHPAWAIGHSWSLSIEEHFYLIWPLIISLSAARWGRAAALTAICACFVIRWIILLVLPAFSPMAELWTFCRIDSIAMGCLLAFLAWDGNWRGRLDWFVCKNGLVLLTAGVLVGMLALSSFSAKAGVGLGYSTNAACIALLLWAAVKRTETRLVMALNHWSMEAIGVASYSLYLWQQLFLDHGNSSFVCTFPLNIFVAALAAFASYQLVEKPFLLLKDWIVSAPPQREEEINSLSQPALPAGDCPRPRPAEMAI